MSATPVEAVEPDPAATSLQNDETVNAKQEEKTDTNGAEAAKELEKANGEKDETEDTKKNEENPRRSGRKHQGRYEKRENNSKYDPSVLENTDDHKQIRAQVWPSTQDIFSARC